MVNQRIGFHILANQICRQALALVKAFSQLRAIAEVGLAAVSLVVVGVEEYWFEIADEVIQRQTESEVVVVEWAR